MIRQALSVCVLVLVTSVSAAAQSTLFLVRHAERADGGMPTMPGGETHEESGGPSSGMYL